eukprot:tig00000882_g5279.t1
MDDGCSLVCPNTQQTALVPFNCTFVPKRAGFVIYGLADNVTANATNADAVVFEPAGSLATQFTITVTAWATPVTNGSSAIRVLAWLPGMETQLAEAGSAIVYIADESSSLACGVAQLILTAVVDCTLTPRRLGELVWADAATIGFSGDGALSPVAGSLQPGAGPAQSFVFQMIAEPGRLLTGPSVAMALSTCPDRVWAGQLADCLFIPRLNEFNIWARLDDTAVSLHNLVLGAAFPASLTGYVPMLGYATSGQLIVNTTAEPSAVFTGPGLVEVVLQSSPGNPLVVLASASIHVMDIPQNATDKSTLSCPSHQLPALVPFNCTFVPKRAGFVIYGLADNVTANSTNADAVFFEPAGSLATQFTITVTAWATPVTNGSSAIRVLAWLPGMETQLAEAGSAIVYIADESSSLACGVAQLILTAVVDCTLTPRRLGELVWADAATIGFIGDGALSPVAGSLQPGAGPAQSFVFQMIAEPGRLLTGPSVAVALSSNESIANFSITVYGDPDATSSLICSSEPVWASNFTACTLIPRLASQRIFVLMDDLFVSWGGSVLQVESPSGILPEPVFSVSTYSFPTSRYTGPGEVTVAFRANASDVVASASITVIDLPRDSSSSLVCSAFSIVGGQSINCTFSPAQMGVPLVAPLANMSVVIRGVPGSASWMPDAPAIGDLFLISHTAPMLVTGGYMLAVYSTGFNGTVFEDAASTELYVTNSVTEDVHPSIGSMTGGTRVTLTGTALPLNTGAIIEARVCGSPATVLSLTTTEAIILTPSAPGYVAPSKLPAAAPSNSTSNATATQRRRVYQIEINVNETTTNSTAPPGPVSTFSNDTAAPAHNVSAPATNGTATAGNDTMPAPQPVGLTFCDIEFSVGGVLSGVWPSSFRYNNPPVAYIEPLPSRVALPIASLPLSAFLSFDPDIVAQRGAPAPSEGLFFAWSVVGPGPAHFGNDSLANVTVANLTAPGMYTFTVDVMDEDGGELASASVTTEVVLLPVLVTTLRIDTAFDAFQLKYAEPAYKASVRGSLAKAYGVSDGRIAGLSAKAGSVIMSVNITATSLAEADSLQQIAQGFAVQPLADVLQVPASSIVQTNASILNRGENTPPMPILNGPKDIEVNGSTFWALFDGRQSSDVDGSVQTYVWNLIPDPGCPLTQADLDTSVPGFCNVTAKKQGFCQIEFNVEDADLTTSTEPVTINLVMNPRQNLPPVIFGTRKIKGRLESKMTSTSLRLEPRIADQDEDGSIASVRWEQVFGPGNATLKSSGQTAVEISGLTAGKWRFRVLATDNGVMGVLPPMTSKADFDVEVVATNVVDSVDPETAKAAGQASRSLEASREQWQAQLPVPQPRPLEPPLGADAPSPKVEGDTNTGTTVRGAPPLSFYTQMNLIFAFLRQTLINQTQKIAVIGGIAGDNVPESYKAMSSSLGTFMLQFNVVPMDGAGSGAASGPTPTPSARPTARKMLQAAATAATMSASETARKAFHSAMLYGFGILAIVTVVHLLLHVLLVRVLKKLPKLPGKLAFPFPELAVLMCLYQPMALASAAYLPLAPPDVQAGIFIFLIFGCVLVPVLFLCVLIYRIRHDRLLIYEPFEPLFQTFTGSRAPAVFWDELREEQRERVEMGAYRRPGQRAFGSSLPLAPDEEPHARRSADGSESTTTAAQSERTDALLEELDDAGFDSDGRARRTTAASRIRMRLRRAVAQFAFRVGNAVDFFFDKLERIMFRGTWVVNDREHGRRAQDFADGWSLLYSDFTDKQMAFLTSVLSLVRQLLSVLIVGIMSAQHAQRSSGEAPNGDNVVSSALATVGESFTPMLQVTLLLGINIFTLVLHIVARPFLCRWVGIVEAITLLEETIMMLAILQVDLGWGWDAGAIMFQVAVIMSFVLVADNMLGKLQLLKALVQKRETLANGVRSACGAVSDLITGRARALRINCSESRIALELLASKTRNAWTVLTDIEWTLRPDADPPAGEAKSKKAAHDSQPKPTSASVDLESPYRSRYDSMLLGLLRALRRTPAAVDGTTRLRISVAERDAREGALHGDLAKAIRAVAALKRQKRREDAAQKAAASRPLLHSLRARFAKKKKEKVDDGAEEEQAAARADGADDADPDPALRPTNADPDANAPKAKGDADGVDSNREENAESEKPDRELKWGEAEAKLGNDVALDELLGKHGLFSEEERAAELGRRKSELARLAERGRLKGDRGQTRRLQAEWETADKERARRMRHWRGVARELWRFEHAELLAPGAPRRRAPSRPPRPTARAARAGARSRARRSRAAQPGLSPSWGGPPHRHRHARQPLPLAQGPPASGAPFGPPAPSPLARLSGVQHPVAPVFDLSPPPAPAPPGADARSPPLLADGAGSRRGSLQPDADPLEAALQRLPPPPPPPAAAPRPRCPTTASAPPLAPIQQSGAENFCLVQLAP